MFWLVMIWDRPIILFYSAAVLKILIYRIMLNLCLIFDCFTRVYSLDHESLNNEPFLGVYLKLYTLQ